MARRGVAGVLVALLGAAAVAVVGVRAQAEEALVATEYGLVQGVVEAGHRAFFGIPTAQPPVGDLRWRSPAPPLAWAGVRDATVRQRDCIQGDPQRTWFAETSEDCLYLNLWTPRAANITEPLPVLVFFHGGSNSTPRGAGGRQGGGGSH